MTKFIKKYKITKASAFVFLLAFVFFFVLLRFYVAFENKEVDLAGLKLEQEENVQQEETPQVEKEELKIGFVTDAHCYSNNSKKTGYQWKLNWRCSEPLETFVDKMNNDFHPDFVIDGGDIIDGKDGYARGSFAFAKKIYQGLEAPLYHVMGNHDTKSFTEEEWSEELGYDKPYYYFDEKGYRIIVLDGNYRPLSEEGLKHTEKGFLYYLGAIGADEMGWLKSTLSSGEKVGLTNVVFIHQPPIGVDARPIEKLFIRGKELQELFAKYNTRAVFSGHIERLCDMQISGIDYFVLQGFWKGNDRLREEFQYRNSGVFSEITISPNGDIKTKMFYRKEGEEREEYSSLMVDPESANCLDGEDLVKK